MEVCTMLMANVSRTRLEFLLTVKVDIFIFQPSFAAPNSSFMCRVVAIDIVISCSTLNLPDPLQFVVHYNFMF
jgi:hypothetical protein